MSRLCLILFGSPGSGKGTQAKLIQQSRGWAHISTGDMLRERIASHDELGSKVASIMQSGSLVPDDLVNRMVEERIEQQDCKKAFILDGYPRTAEQAQLLDGLLQAQGITPVVVHLKVDYNVIISRLSGRRQCPTCGALYSVNANHPKVSEVCDYDGSKLTLRDDDRPEVVEQRLKAYERQTTPVLDFLKKLGYPVIEVDGAAGSPLSIAARLEVLIEERRAGNAKA